MNSESAGFLEYRDRVYRFDRASCQWSWGGLDLQAEGRGVTFTFVAIPFAGAEQVRDLPGRVWEPDADEMALDADTFVEGWFRLRNRDQQVTAAWFKCLSYNADAGRLVVEFRLLLEDEETGREAEVEGAARCEVLA